MTHFELVVFDWEGTVADPTARAVAALQAACGDLDLPAPSAAVLRETLAGGGLLAALQQAARGVTLAEEQRLVARFRYHHALSASGPTLFPGMAELIGRLRAQGRWLGVATGMGRNRLDQALAHTKLGPCFHATRCADDCFSKPHPQMLEELMEEMGVAPEMTLMVGDTTHDLEMARNAGVAALAVAYGAHSYAALSAHEPVAVVRSPAALGVWFETSCAY